MTTQEVEDIINNLQKNANMALNLEVATAQSLYKGYHQACEDFGRCVRELIRNANQELNKDLQELEALREKQKVKKRTENSRV